MTQVHSQAHSHIGASSMYRWSKCPGSVRLCKDIPPQISEYAAEGTRAHEVAAKWLTDRKTTSEGLDFETYEAIRTYYVEVMDNWHSDDEVLIEHRFDLSQIHPGLYGTADCVIYDPTNKRLHVYDYKHGAGVAVEVENNPQLMYYALGALLSKNYKVADVEMIVVQPRCPHPDGPVRRWSIPAIDLIDFSVDLKKYAVATEVPDATLLAGSHCRFCPAAANACSAIKNKAQILAKEEFAPQFSYDPARLAEVLTWLPTLKSWIKNVEEFAENESNQGRIPPGFKLVAKRGSRKWIDEDKVKTFLEKYEGCYDVKLKSPAQIEKHLGKGVIDHLVITESSGFTLVPESDKRQSKALDVKTEFTDVTEENALFI